RHGPDRRALAGDRGPQRHRCRQSRAEEPQDRSARGNACRAGARQAHLMALAVERLIAWRYLRARREEGFISVIAGFSLVGIALGVGTLIVVMAVMNGFQIEMLRQMSSISGQLGVQGSRGIDATPELLGRIRAV